ncbi:MAG TPA: hypothetical protein VFH82_07425 [Gemmatimonadota bacterium]|nr:hypothetical protein [Gemmatimonadota bacterium]
MEKIPTRRRVVCRAVQDFPCEIDGEPVTVTAGSRFDMSHPVVLAHPEMFEKLPVRYEVEQATAAPGERRKR